MFSRHNYILVFFGILGVLLVPVGDIMTIQGRFAKGDDSSIYLVDFDESDYDLYIKGYYPSDYTYDDFRRDSIEGMVSHYVATDNNNFSSVVDTIEQDVLQNGWSVIKDFFVDSWIDLKSGVVTVAEGFTDDFKHTLDGRFKSGGSSGTGGSVTIGSGRWVYVPSGTSQRIYGNMNVVFYNTGSYDLWVGAAGSSTLVLCSFNYGAYGYSKLNNNTNSDGTCNIAYFDLGYYTSSGVRYTIDQTYMSFYANVNAAVSDFFGNAPSPEPVWNGTGYYSDTPTNYSINIPALPAIDWQSISNNNKTKYGVDFPDVDLSIDFQLPDSYYPQTVTYDTPYWLYNTDSTPVDWANVSFEDVTLPEVQLSDGDGSFFQALFNTLPLAFVPILLGVILCYLIFLML